ncbi:MAG: amino acid ABC transporter permease [Rhizobiales bacterium]|nr:amino acid ABC transporter permease [Hyphomicrobiales bacterium]
MALVQFRDGNSGIVVGEQPAAGTSISSKARLNGINLLVSAIAVALIVWALYWIVDWAVIRAVWTSEDGSACRVADAGACWAVIHVRWRIILFGLYPYDEQWRSAAACLVIVVTAILSCTRPFHTLARLTLLWLVGFGSFIALMRGGVLGLSSVSVNDWGGLSLTLFIFAAVSITGMPLAIMLALLRRSRLTLIGKTTAIIIDVVRAIPLLAILFTVGVIIPFGLPDALVGEKLYRVIAAFSLYFACYQAEIIRSGFQAIPTGQEEAAQALGMSYRQRVAYVLLPQAFKAVLPPTVNQFVITFLETSLVVVIGFFDVLASGNAAFGTAKWGIAKIEVYLFVAAIFFTFTFSLSRYGAYLERRGAPNAAK